MKVRLCWGALLMSMLLSGCLDSYRTDEVVVQIQEEPSSASVETKDTSPIYLYKLPDRWDAAADQVLEHAEDYKFLRFEVSDLGDFLKIRCFWGEENSENSVMLTGYARKDDGRIERMYIHGRQTDFDEADLLHLQPYYEILIEASNPALSEDERSDLMRTLSLDGDVAALAERSGTDGSNTVTVGNVRYDVAIIASGEGRTYALVATMDKDCTGNRILSPCASAPYTDMEQATHDEKSPVTQSLFVLPDGYQTVQADRFTFAVPDGWHVAEKALHGEFSFQINGTPAGETEILGWFDAETWKDFKPNHTDQSGFDQRDDLLADQRGDVHVYRIQLTHTKPAAEMDPEWKYEETRWYVADKEDGRAYGFNFDSETVDESVMETIVSSFRLNEVGRSSA